MERQLRGGGNVLERHFDGAYRQVLAYGQYAVHQHASLDDEAAVVRNVIGGLHLRHIALVGVVYLDRYAQGVAVGVDKLRETGQGHQETTEIAPFSGRDISLFTPEHVQRADECRALSAVVVQAEQLESGIVRGTQVALNLVFVAECLQLAAGHEELLAHRLHTVVA